MKRSVAILLMIIHLYTIGGQLVIHEFLVYKSDNFFKEQVSKQLYNVEDLTEIKIPVSMPGITDWKSYQYLSGQVQFKNSSYNYVKIRLTRTAIYLMCVPNYETTHLTGQNIINARYIDDLPIPRKDHVPFGKINPVASFSQQAYRYKFLSPVIYLSNNIFFGDANTLNPGIPRRGQPPEVQPWFS